MNYYEIAGSMILREERAQKREKTQAAKPQIFGQETARSLNYH